MTPYFYQPEQTVVGPAYSTWFKLIATGATITLAIYALNSLSRVPLMDLGVGIQTLIVGIGLMLALSYYWFLRSTVTIDAQGIRQTWLYDRHVEWQNVHGAKLIGVPYAAWLFPPRLIVRAGNSFKTFNGGSTDVLIEFAKISVAYQRHK